MAKDERSFGEGTSDAAGGGQRETKGWKAQLQEIIDENGHKRVNGKVASHRTRQHNAEVLFVVFKTLHQKLNLPIYPRNIAERHVKTLVRYWYTEVRAAATMRNELSVLRKFARWIGKPNLVKTLEEYLPDASPERIKVSATARVTKSWSANGIDVEKKLEEAFAIDDRFGMMLAMQLAFGLRRKETILIQPWVSDQRDLGKDLLIVYRGAKGGKQRSITIEFEFQIAVLDMVKERVGKRDSLGWKRTIHGENATLEKNIDRYEYSMQKLGISKANCSVCGHGMRAEYAENCALLEGFTPATLGGVGDEYSPDEMRVRKKRVSERLGHSRPQIMNAYYGSTAAAQKAASQKAAANDRNAEAGPATEASDPLAEPVRAANDAASNGETPASTAAETVAPRSTRARGLLGNYYKTAPAGRKHPDDLESTPTQGEAKIDAAKHLSSAGSARDRKGAKDSSIGETQLFLPSEDDADNDR
ncbi:integrase domain-containing protein [Paraburkholderia hospita]|uniref:integrase domain-containing protein n=2 Tax=Paraburkholderia hospita TaxID=169430 RepID=UPI003ED0AC4D